MNTDWKSTRLRALVESSYEATSVVDVELCGRSFEVWPTVHNPTNDRTSELLVRFVVARAPARLIDVGTGAGVIGIMAAAECNTQVVATDVSPAAVENARANARRHQVEDRYSASLGDLFTVDDARVCDFVVWNSPFIDMDIRRSGPVENSLIDPGYVHHGRFFKLVALASVPAYLVVNRWADRQLIQKRAEEAYTSISEVESAGSYSILRCESRDDRG